MLFSIVERPNKYTFGDFMTPTAPGERSLCYKICPLFKCSNCYLEVCIHISGEGGEFSTGGVFHGDNLSWGGKFTGDNFSGEILN